MQMSSHTRVFGLTLLLVVVSACGGGSKELLLGSTTSTQDSGLLDVLIPAFEKAEGYHVKTIAVGSGQAIKMGAAGEVDVLLVHSPKAEEELVASGVTGRRLLVMHNDFVIVGPKSDPAGIRGVAPADALQRIESTSSSFVSRGDESGTHKAELALWAKAGKEPSGGWYKESGQGQGATLQIASQTSSYTLTDRGTWLANRAGLPALEVLVEGDPGLKNVYHVIELTRKAGLRVSEQGSRAFADWIVGSEAQGIIETFGVEAYGRPLFTADAGSAEETP